MMFGPGTTSPPQTPEVKSLYHVHTLCGACRKYALDHDKTFPASLDDLFPAYLQDRAILTSPLNPSEPVGYSYKGALKAPVPNDTVLIEDKFPPLHKRIVAYADGSAKILLKP